MSANQISFVSLDKLVAENHQYRKFKEVLDFSVADKLIVSNRISCFYIMIK